MCTIRFILAFGELLISPAMLLWYGWAPTNANIGDSAKQPLDFYPQLG